MKLLRFKNERYPQGCIGKVEDDVVTDTCIKCDQTIKLNGFYVSKDYPEKLRPSNFTIPKKRPAVGILTNNFKLTALKIAMLYKHRWYIETFFKWVK